MMMMMEKCGRNGGKRVSEQIGGKAERSMMIMAVMVVVKVVVVGWGKTWCGGGGGGTVVRMGAVSPGQQVTSSGLSLSLTLLPSLHSLAQCVSASLAFHPFWFLMRTGYVRLLNFHSRQQKIKI